MNANIVPVLIRIIEEYRAAHPEEAAEADAWAKDHKPFSEAEPMIFLIQAEEGE